MAQRHMLVGGIAALAVVGLGGLAKAQGLQADSGARIAYGGWLLRGDRLDTMGDSRSKLLQKFSQAAHFVHYYVIVRTTGGAEMQLHGLPVDGQLQVRCGSLATTEAYRGANGNQLLGEVAPGDASTMAIAGMLDADEAINAARIPYAPISIKAAPLNSNAAAAAEAAMLGLENCGAVACPALAEAHDGIFAPGVNAGLVSRLPNIGGAWRARARQGISAEEMVTKFCTKYPWPARVSMLPPRP